MVEIWIARHGQTTSNCQRVLQGQQQGELTAVGQKQSESLAARLKEISFDAIYCSDLKRAVDTLAPFATQVSIPIHYTVQIRERNLKELEGEPYEKIRSLQQQWGDNFAPGDNESLAALRQRAVDFLNFIKQNHQGQTVLACSHSMFIRMLLSYLLDLSPMQASMMAIHNSSLTQIRLSHDQWEVPLINSIYHLSSVDDIQTVGPRL